MKEWEVKVLQQHQKNYVVAQLARFQAFLASF